tara:strand:+ start:2699 stop:3040 length:342 start_codon:yes stop_codon:yes gene_type:complete
MGVFSWKTQDTDKSIAVDGNPAGVEHFRVTMTDNKGNRWHEPNYGGYGEFDGKDYYELLAQMNGGEGRGFGIELTYNKEGKKFITPNLTENPMHKWTDNTPEDCEHQGFFYDW